MGQPQRPRRRLAVVAPSTSKGTLVVIEGADDIGRSTHIHLLKHWLERSGHGVVETSTAQSVVAGKGLKKARAGHMLGGLTMSLFYATAFADQLERDVKPALRAGFVVLMDRYTYSLMASAAIRGADAQWLKRVYSFAPTPDLVIYLRTNVDALVSRVVNTTGFNYWESGMDLRLGDDLFDSFVEYQGRLLTALDAMASKHRFHVVDAAGNVDAVADTLQSLVAPLLVRT